MNPVCCNWHPLAVLSLTLVCQVVGLKPWGHHLPNVLLHALNAALVFVVPQQIAINICLHARDKFYSPCVGRPKT